MIEGSGGARGLRQLVPAVKAVLFVLLSLGLWVALSWVFGAAYERVVTDLTLNTRWLLLLLPVAIWIAARALWPPGPGYGE